MKNLIYKISFTLFLSCLVLIACNKDKELDDTEITYEFIKGYWIDQESFALQFIDFYSNNQARFGFYSRDLFTKYDTFNYRLFDNKIAIDFNADNEIRESFHDILIRKNNIIEITDLTVIPENPNKIYKKQSILTVRQNDTINISLNEIYYDPIYDFRLEIDSVLTDSRCPEGVNCIWEGNAEVRLELIVGGNYHHYLNLNTNPVFQQDTVISGIVFHLTNILPYPDAHNDLEYQNYRIEIITNEQ